ncbi:Rhodanese-related sulfurtransferase [Tenacibaculum sp. MAR_2010_89]|uniref:rhodanese-like domain-containing protein n=1 Tax=Tenacibaculum sp. MAR_2010_89 TaxID=1250198 RepID=UPI000895638F|nr:rhodanese-like domain-containing protein [Tenacibaculum sp. MAR_2010_89]SEE07926.1 Rhodanese-related sulfurtransferase [Tenacibaculum sp. MAR_2010_89]
MKNLIYIFLFSLAFSVNAQKNLNELLKKFNTENIPYITSNDLNKLIQQSIISTQNNDQIILLDSREPKEYKVSHINNAICVGYDHFNIRETIKKLPVNKNTKIIVYCSLGIRSEDIAEKLKKTGYTNIYNLYGGIFEWKNQGNQVVNKQQNTTEKIHTFNKEWSKWLLKGEKIY